MIYCINKGTITGFWGSGFDWEDRYSLREDVHGKGQRVENCVCGIMGIERLEAMLWYNRTRFVCILYKHTLCRMVDWVMSNVSCTFSSSFVSI